MILAIKAQARPAVAVKSAPVITRGVLGPLTFCLVLGAVPAYAQAPAPVKPQGTAPKLKQGPKSGAPAPAGPPYTLTAPALTITGTGSLPTARAFAPLTFTAPELSVTGTGALVATAPFTSVQFTAPALTVTGTGKLR